MSVNTLQNWKPTRFGDVCKTNRKTFSLSEKWAFVNYLDTGNITENRIDEIQHLVIGRDALPSRARRKVDVGDIIYSTVRPNQRHYGIVKSVLIPRKGSLNNVLYINEPFWTVDTMFYTQMTRPNVAKFAYFTVRDLDLAGMNVGSAVPSMTTAVLNELEIVLPSDESLAKFEECVSPMFLQIQANNADSARLAIVRDGLLPKLMNGELTVSDG